MVQVELDALDPNTLRDLYRTAIDDAWDPEKRLLILDLEGVDHIDSAGVTELVLIKKRARRQGGGHRLLSAVRWR